MKGLINALAFGTIALVPSLVLSENAQAALISGVTASSDMGSGFRTDIGNTINGVGLSSLSLTATHDATTPSNSWVSSLRTLIGNITFNLNSTYSLSGFSFWNQNGGGPGSNGSTGIRNVSVQTSTDGINFIPLAGGSTQFSQVSGSENLPPEIFNFTPVDASYVKFVVFSNWGDTRETGFAEVQFNGTQSVPEPSEVLDTLAFGAFGTGYLLKRRLKKHKSVNSIA